MERALGFDVSHWHPILDASRIPETYRFVGIKASEGTANVDPTLARHRDAVRAVPGRFDMVVYYHLARPGDGAAQAARFVALVGALQPNERMALDTERTSAVDVRFLLDFFRELPRDRRPLLYTSNGVWVGMRNPSFPEARGIDLWLPRYGSAAEPMVPDPWHQVGKSWTLWQTAQDASVPGVDGPCDLNAFNGDAAALRTYAAPGAAVAA